VPLGRPNACSHGAQTCTNSPTANSRRAPVPRWVPLVQRAWGAYGAPRPRAGWVKGGPGPGTPWAPASGAVLTELGSVEARAA
jgi:hypothetical protein